MPWKKLLACVTGQIDEALRQKLEFVLEENRVYRALLARHSPHWRLQDAERKVLAEKRKPLGKLLADVITLVQPETLLKWHRQLVAVWSNNSSVKFQCCHSGFVLDSCAVNLPPCLGKSCWLVSLDKSMRPCIKNWSSFWKKTMCIARSWNGIHLTGGCRMLSARFSPKRANPSVSCWRTSSPWSNPKPCSNGIANWSPRNGTFPAAGTPNRVGRPSQLRLNNWWCKPPAKTQAGVMTALLAPWLTWGITFPIRRWAIFCNDRGWARHPNANATPPGPRSSAGTRPCSGPPTSSPLKSGPPPAWPPTTSCSSSTSKPAASSSLASLLFPMKPG